MVTWCMGRVAQVFLFLKISELILFNFLNLILNRVNNQSSHLGQDNGDNETEQANSFSENQDQNHGAERMGIWS